MSHRDFWDESPAYEGDTGVLTLEKLRELPSLDADVADRRYLEAGIATNHGMHDPKALNKASKRLSGKNRPKPRPTSGPLAVPKDAPPLDLSDF